MTKKILELFHFWAGAELPPIEALFSRFEEKFNIRILRNITEWNLYMWAVKTRITSGEPPDIAAEEIGQKIFELARSDYLTDLSNLWEKEGFSNAFPAWIIENCSLDGRVYGVPIKHFTFAVWYLTKLFDEYRIKPPRTWKEFLNICTAFKEAGIHPIIASGWETSLWFNHILAGTGGVEFYKKLMRGQEKWTSKPVINAYQILAKLSKQFFYPNPFGYTFPIAWAKLNKREAAMQLQGDWLAGMWRREYGYTPGKDFDCFILPPIDPKAGRVMVVGGNAWIFPKHAKNKAEANKFLRFAGSLEAQELLVREEIGISPRIDVKKEAFNPVLWKLRDEILKSQVVLWLLSSLPEKILNAEGLRRMKIVLNPDLNLEEIKQLCAQIEMVANEYYGMKRLYTFLK